MRDFKISDLESLKKDLSKKIEDAFNEFIKQTEVSDLDIQINKFMDDYGIKNVKIDIKIKI